MIYFLQPTTGGPIKIGYTDNVEARHKQLEAHYGQPLALLATLPGGRDQEREIHSRFAVYRMGRTEQFFPVADIMAFIGRPLLVSPDPDAVEAMDGKRYGTLVRVTDQTAEILRRVARQEDISVAEFMTRHVEPIAEKRYRELIAREAKRLAGGNQE